MSKFCIKTFDALASANELAAMVVMNIAGEDLADSIEGSPLTRAQVFAMMQTKVQAQFAAKLEN
jgi:hypothetical protein